MDQHSKIMKKGFINLYLVVLGAILAVWLGFYIALTIDKTQKLGAADTALTDTINTFRINYNALNSQMKNATSVDPGHLHSINVSTGTITTLTFTGITGTSASTTNITASGYGLFGSLIFTNATGTNQIITGVASTSQSYIASSTVTGTSTVTVLVIGASSATVKCPTIRMAGTSTLFYWGVNTSTYTLFATSTKPIVTCN